MSWDDFRDKQKQEEKAKKPILSHYNQGHYYTVLRIGKKYKTFGQIKGFTCHMERQRETPNADLTISNIPIIGGLNLMEDIKEYTKDVRYIRPDSTLCRELLLSASPGFFKGIPPEELDKWKELNRRWLENEFGDNVRYAVLHLDEST